jgi:hypothetical protein
MDSLTTLLEILKYTIPSMVVLASSYLIVRKFLITENQRKQLALFQDAQDTTLRLRLQAYERLILFIERISPRQMIPRLYEPAMTVRDLQLAIINNIRNEFEYNLSQQIYVSRNVWETVKNVKEQELNMVNQVGKKLAPEAPARELHTLILDIVMKAEEELPTEIALHTINEEVRILLSYGAR